MSNKIILASKSEVRKKILDKNNIESIVEPSNVDEEIVKISLLKEKVGPEIISKNLAELKANKVSIKKTDEIVLGADSVIDLEGELISKPKSREEAMEILKKLAGLQENPLLDPPGSKFKFGQDRGEKLPKDQSDTQTMVSNAMMDIAEFYSAIGNAHKQGQLVGPDDQPVRQLDSTTLALAYDFHKKGEKDPVSAYAQATAKQGMSYMSGDFSEEYVLAKNRINDVA
mgnify:CR=1 FL=1